MQKIGVTIKIKNSWMNNSVENLSPFNEGQHQGLLKLPVHLGCGVGCSVCSMERKRGLCYVALLQRSQVSAGFHYGNLIFGI